jgi:hypothetical protein
MSEIPAQAVRGSRPALRSRTVFFGGLLCVFAVILLLAGRRVGLTTNSFPPERHPSLLFAHNDIPLMRERLTRAPYRTWMRRLDQFARSDSAVTAMSEEVVRAHRARAAALAYQLTGDRRYADRAADLLRAARRPSCGGRWRALDDIVEGAAAWAVAYDMLAPYLAGNEALEAKARLMVSDLAQELYAGRYAWPSPGGDTRELRQLSALGLCALAIRDYVPGHDQPGPRDWHRRARHLIPLVAERQICRDGAYAEGPGRQASAAEMYVPFCTADRLVMDEDLLPGELLKACEWSTQVAQPDGVRPSLDDSATTTSCNYELTSHQDAGPLFAWDAARTDLATSVPDTHLVEALTLYDDRVRPQAPTWPSSQALEGSGDVVFRTDWSPKATYMLVRGEHGVARTAGGNYEQADSTSFILSRGDEPLVLEGGFGGWDVRDEGAAPSAHNLVLRDGMAPPVRSALGAVVQVDVDVQTLDQVFDPAASAVRLRRVNDRTIFDRTVVFAGDRGAFVFDQLRAGDGAHRFTWQVNLNGGGTTDGRITLDGDSALLRRPDAALRLALIPSDPDAEPLNSSPARHYFHEGEPQTHALLRSSARGQQVSFLAVMAPADDVASLPALTVSRGQHQLAANVGTDAHVAFRDSRGEPIGDGNVRSDGMALLWLPDKSGGPGAILTVGASHLWVDGRLVWSDRLPHTLVWRPARIIMGDHLSDA